MEKQSRKHQKSSSCQTSGTPENEPALNLQGKSNVYGYIIAAFSVHQVTDSLQERSLLWMLPPVTDSYLN
jgi:hypothetical protein